MREGVERGCMGRGVRGGVLNCALCWCGRGVRGSARVCV